MRSPAGDQLGSRSSAPRVSCTRPVPSVWIFQIVPCVEMPCGCDSNTICCPSGDSDGSNACAPERWVTLCAPVPSGLMIHTSSVSTTSDEYTILLDAPFQQPGRPTFWAPSSITTLGDPP